MGKIFQDSVHGLIELSESSIKIIDTPEYQRLRNIKQLGAAYYVFSSASHNRFEHSIGVAFLAKQFLKELQMNQPELNITEEDLINVEIAGLCHDLGHGPFSHIYDDMFLANKLKDNHPYRHHESRSCAILEMVVKKYGINISDKNLRIIQQMIDPTDKKLAKTFLYQIVCNKINGIDVDKFDYLVRDTYAIGLKFGFDYSRFFHQCRVINGEICYNHKEIFNVYEMFHTRFRLHKQIYSHLIIKKIDMMLADIFRYIDASKHPLLYLSDAYDDLDKFCKITDNILEKVEMVYEMMGDEVDKNLEAAYKICMRLKKREFYKVEREIFLTDRDNLDEILAEYNLEDKDDYCYSLRKIGFTNNNLNPLFRVKFYNKEQILKKRDINNRIGTILPKCFEERSVIIFRK
jgi:HD superfamily phosphohydrolase